MKILIFLVSLILYGKKIRQDQAKYNGKSLPFYGGWFIYLGYEIAKEIEKKIQIPKSPFFFPDAFAARVHSAIIYDHIDKNINYHL